MTSTIETGTLNPVQFYAPLVNPSPTGLWAATAWQTDFTVPERFLTGVHIIPQNFDGTEASGVWGADWCADAADLAPDDVKKGTRWPGLDPFEALTIWAAEGCALDPLSRAESTSRAEQTLRLNEQQLFEREFTGRLLADVTAEGGPVLTTSDFVDAVGELEDYIAMGGQTGVIHAPVKYAARAAGNMLLVKTGSGFQTPLGNRWVFGGGYSAGLADNMVATSALYGWRGEVAVREAIKQEWNQHVVIAERSAVVGYEHLYAAVKFNHTPAP